MLFKSPFIYCLIDDFSNVDGAVSYTLNHEAVGRISPFLQCFPRLECAIIGGSHSSIDDFQYYSVSECRAPTNHEAMLSSLLFSLGGAFASKALSQSVCLEGVFGCCKKYHCREDSCILCRYILHNFPLSTIVCCFGKENGYDRSDFCISVKDVCEIIKKRKWTRECIRIANKEVLSHRNSNLYGIVFAHTSDIVANSGEIFGKKLSSEWSACDTKFLYYIPERKLKRLEILHDLGCQVMDYGREYWNGKHDLMFTFGDDWNSGKQLLIPARTYERLVRIGYPLERDDFVLVQESDIGSFDFIEDESNYLNYMNGQRTV